MLHRAIRYGLVALGLVGVAGAAAAHHGWADYDPQRPVNLVGTVRVIGERHRRNAQEVKIEWIVIGGDTAQIRRG